MQHEGVTTGVLKVKGWLPHEVLGKALESRIHHIYAQTSPYCQFDMHLANIMQYQPVEFMSRPEIIFSKTSSDLAKLHTYERTFHKASQKPKVMEELNCELKKFVSSSSLTSEIILIADELYTNAIFNAPFSVQGVSAQKHRQDNSVEMGEGLTGRLYFTADESLIMMGCEDPFGSLSVEKFLRRILDCYVQGVANTMNMGRGGAGIGSFLMFEMCTSFVVAVEAGVRTHVACILPYRLSRRKRGEIEKSLHVLNY